MLNWGEIVFPREEHIQLVIQYQMVSTNYVHISSKALREAARRRPPPIRRFFLLRRLCLRKALLCRRLPHSRRDNPLSARRRPLRRAAFRPAAPLLRHLPILRLAPVCRRAPIYPAVSRQAPAGRRVLLPGLAITVGMNTGRYGFPIWISRVC